MATIKDIAKRLNISISTVSYALNDGPRKVPEDVKAKVWATARELNYRPNRLAKQLVTRRTNTIGIVPDSEVSHSIIGPYLRTLFATTLQVAEQNEKDVLFITGHATSPQEVYANLLLDGRIDGALIVTGQTRRPLLDILDERDFPYVLINDDGHRPDRSFRVDNFAGINTLLDHLVELGHRSFGLVQGIAGMPDAEARTAAFDQYILKHNLTHRPAWRAYGDFVIEGGERAAHQILSQTERPTAIVALNDESALGVIKAARERGIQVPQDLSVTGFDDTEWVRLTDPAPTTVGQPTDKIAHAATTALLALIDGVPCKGQVFAPDFEVRASTSRPPEDNSL